MIDGNKVTDALIRMIKRTNMPESDRGRLITVCYYLYDCFDEQESLRKKAKRLEKDNYRLAKQVLDRKEK